MLTTTSLPSLSSLTLSAAEPLDAGAAIFNYPVSLVFARSRPHYGRKRPACPFPFRDRIRDFSPFIRQVLLAHTRDRTSPISFLNRGCAESPQNLLMIE